MISTQTIISEKRRLDALHQTRILDTSREKQFDRVVCMAAAIFRVPIAAISLIAEARQWLKAYVGDIQVEMPRDLSFCNHTITAAVPVVVEDATADPRFRCNPLVTAGPKIRFYAGVPLQGPDAQLVGALCIIDVAPRALRPSQLSTLMQLGDDVSEILRVYQAPSVAGR